MNPNTLSYQFIFLFRRQRTIGSHLIKEPAHLPNHYDQVPDDVPPTEAISYPDDDKRIFRLHIPPAKNNQELGQLLSESWRKVTAQYEKCRLTNTETLQHEERNASENLLLSVALLIIDDQLTKENHHAKLPIYDPIKKEVQGHCFYHPQETLFELSPDSLPLDQPAAFIQYNPELKANQLTTSFNEVHQWQLSFNSHDEPCLIELNGAEHNNHIAFLVYGLARHDLAANKHADWQEQLDDFLLFGKKPIGEKKSKGYAALMFLLAPLLTQHWQHNQIDTASRHLDRRLMQLNAHYGSMAEISVRCKTRTQLEHELHEMKSLIARASYEIGRIGPAIQTLQINRETLLERMRIIGNIALNTWRFDWQWEDKAFTALQQQRAQAGPSATAEPKLIDRFDYNIENLSNRQYYINGKLTHLRGSSERWELALEEQKLELYEKLGHIGHGIILLVALAEMGHVLHNAVKADHGSAAAAHGTEAAHWYQPILDGLHWLDTSSLIHFLAGILQSPTLFLIIVLFIVYPAITAWWRFRSRRRLYQRQHQQLINDKDST